MIKEHLKKTVPYVVGATMASAMFTAWPLVDYFYERTMNLTPTINEINYLMQFSTPVIDTTRHYTRGGNWIIIKDYEKSIDNHEQLYRSQR